MLRRNIGYIANLYFGTDYTSIASNALQKVIQIVLGGKMRIAYYLNSCNYVPLQS